MAVYLYKEWGGRCNGKFCPRSRKKVFRALSGRFDCVSESIKQCVITCDQWSQDLSLDELHHQFVHPSVSGLLFLRFRGHRCSSRNEPNRLFAFSGVVRLLQFNQQFRSRRLQLQLPMHALKPSTRCFWGRVLLLYCSLVSVLSPRSELSRTASSLWSSQSQRKRAVDPWSVPQSDLCASTAAQWSAPSRTHQSSSQAASWYKSQLSAYTH